MPEGLLQDGKVSGAVHDDPDSPPAPDAEHPRGWTWDRKGRRWKGRERGKILFGGDAPAAAADDAGPGGQQQRDPDPGWLRGDSGPGSGQDDGKVKFEDVPQEVKNDIAGLMGLVGTPILAMLRSVDPYCGTALAQSFEGIVDATLPLICRSSKIVKYFAEDQADWLLWGKLAMALAPVGRAIVEHHITRTVQVVRDEQTGQVQIVRVQPGQPQGDHLTPPQQHQYAA